MKKLRKIQALLLSLALLVPIACNGTAVSILNDTQAVSAPLNFDEAVVESVKKESDNPDRACEMINDIDDDPLDTNLGKCEITGAEFTNNSVRLTCVSPAQCSVQQCLFSDNNGKSWFYRLDMPEGYKHFSKNKPMKLEHFEPVIEW